MIVLKLQLPPSLSHLLLLLSFHSYLTRHKITVTVNNKRELFYQDEEDFRLVCFTVKQNREINFHLFVIFFQLFSEFFIFLDSKNFKEHPIINSP